MNATAESAPRKIIEILGDFNTCAYVLLGIIRHRRYYSHPYDKSIEDGREVLEHRLITLRMNILDFVGCAMGYTSWDCTESGLSVREVMENVKRLADELEAAIAAGGIHDTEYDNRFGDGYEYVKKQLELLIDAVSRAYCEI